MLIAYNEPSVCVCLDLSMHSSNGQGHALLGSDGLGHALFDSDGHALFVSDGHGYNLLPMPNTKYEQKKNQAMFEVMNI